MSNYRDDTQETAVAHDSTWLKVATIAEDSAKAASTLLFGFLVLHADLAAASDAVEDRAGQIVSEQAQADDSVSDHLYASVLLSDQRRASDTLIERLRVLHAESASAADSALDHARALIVEQAAISDEVLGQRHAQSLVSESARISDYSGQFASVLIEDAATVLDWSAGRWHARELVGETATLGEQWSEVQRGGAIPVEAARVSTLVLDHLHAVQLVQDGAVIEDALPGETGGQAWTANADTWAMSRYAPFAFTGLAVIDGTLYATGSEGVYRLGAGSEVVAGRLATGKLDLGQGALVHPTAAYLEYSLDGALSLDVTTTQSGAAQTYTYQLPAEPAQELTNGRISLGRGLRGRHFSFALNLQGRGAYINDLRIEAAPTKRRV